jgi:hypothetical protein
MGDGAVWMPLREALERAGGFEALQPHLWAGRILARHGGLYDWPKGYGVESKPGNIHRDWWAAAYVDPDSGRVILTQDLSGMIVGPGPPIPREVFAIGIEVEREAVERMFPANPPHTAPATQADVIGEWNAVRDAVQAVKWAQWQAAADRIGKAHPRWFKTDVAAQVKKDLKAAETADTIRKKIRKTW